MDTNLHPTFAAILAELAKPVTMETADGFLVISKALSTGSVVPPYRYQYNHEYFPDTEAAEERMADFDNGEWRGWSFVALVPCRQGVPLGAKVIP